MRLRQPVVSLRVAALALTLALAPVGCRHAPPGYSPAMTAPVVEASPAPDAGGRSQRTPVPVERQANLATDSQVTGEDLLGKPVSTEVGLASWYGPPYHNRQAADGSVFDQNALTAAHRTLPMGTMVRVTNVATSESVIAKITDRGPFIPGRTLDLSLAAAKAIGLYRAGVATVKVEAFANSTADPAGRWCVQIGVFIDPADAVQTKNDMLRRYGGAAKVIDFAGPTGHWVRINPNVPDRATATRIADSIHLPDAEPYLVRTN